MIQEHNNIREAEWQDLLKKVIAPLNTEESFWASENFSDMSELGRYEDKHGN